MSNGKSIFEIVIGKDEGWSSSPYLCSEGYPTVAHGVRIGPKDADLSLYQFTVPKEVGDLWLSVKISGVYAQVQSNSFSQNAWDSFDGNEARQCVMISMCYQLGLSGFLKFKKAISAMTDGNFYKASREMLDSVWQKQTPTRAVRLAEMMRTGELHDHYL